MDIAPLLVCRRGHVGQTRTRGSFFFFAFEKPAYFFRDHASFPRSSSYPRPVDNADADADCLEP